jgi:hypothetical protein
MWIREDFHEHDYRESGEKIPSEMNPVISPSCFMYHGLQVLFFMNLVIPDRVSIPAKGERTSAIGISCQKRI